MRASVVEAMGLDPAGNPLPTPWIHPVSDETRARMSEDVHRPTEQTSIERAMSNVILGDSSGAFRRNWTEAERKFREEARVFRERSRDNPTD